MLAVTFNPGKIDGGLVTCVWRPFDMCCGVAVSFPHPFVVMANCSRVRNGWHFFRLTEYKRDVASWVLCGFLRGSFRPSFCFDWYGVNAFMQELAGRQNCLEIVDALPALAT